MRLEFHNLKKLLDINDKIIIDINNLKFLIKLLKYIISNYKYINEIHLIRSKVRIKIWKRGSILKNILNINETTIHIDSFNSE